MRDVTSRRRVGVIALGVMIVFCLVSAQIAFATNEQLTFNPKHPVYNAGYSQGFFGVPLKGTHTVEFFYGYMNGSEDRYDYRGYADGISNLTQGTNQDTHVDHWIEVYIKGYNAAKDDIEKWFGGVDKYGKAWCKGCIGALPKQTNDNYTNYYIGLNNGELASVKLDNAPFMGDRNNESLNHSIIRSKCPTGHDMEYCAGYKAGWNRSAAFWA